MTSAQERALKRVERMVKSTFYDDKCEIKEWKVSENEYFVALLCEWGRKNDEGTLAEIFARDRCQLFIGKRGGIRYPVTKTLKNGEFRCYSKRLNGDSVLKVVLEQRVR